MEEKVILLHGDDISSINDMLKDGWTIKNMSACGYQWGGDGVCSCYFHFTRELHKPIND